MVKMKLSLLIVAISFVGAALAAKKYHLSENKENWWKALDSCMSYGMTLASISSKAEEDQIVKQIKAANTSDTYWIGGTNFGASDSKSHYWLGLNKLFTYTNWHRGEPNGFESENCIHLRYQFGYQWNDGQCARPFYYVCEEKDVESSPQLRSSSSSSPSLSSSLGGASGGCQYQEPLQTELIEIEPITENVPTITIGFESEMDSLGTKPGNGPLTNLLSIFDPLSIVDPLPALNPISPLDFF